MFNLKAFSVEYPAYFLIRHFDSSSGKVLRNIYGNWNKKKALLYFLRFFLFLNMSIKNRTMGASISTYLLFSTINGSQPYWKDSSLGLGRIALLILSQNALSLLCYKQCLSNLTSSISSLLLLYQLTYLLLKILFAKIKIEGNFCEWHPNPAGIDEVWTELQDQKDKKCFQ